MNSNNQKRKNNKYVSPAERFAKQKVRVQEKLKGEKKIDKLQTTLDHVVKQTEKNK
jgi:hypothetical protein